MQWGTSVLDKLVAPKCSQLTACTAPELPEATNLYGSFFLNNIFLTNEKDEVRSSIIVFLRRLADANRGYRSGRERMLACVEAQQHSTEMVTEYLAALSQFENAVINAYLALMSSETIAKALEANHPRPFQPDDGSPAQRLNVVYNSIKHFYDHIEKGLITKDGPPVWLVDDGLECVGSKGGSALRFDEFAQLLKDLNGNAVFLAETVYQQAHERKAAAAKP
jgi:hypothetical protein